MTLASTVSGMSERTDERTAGEGLDGDSDGDVGLDDEALGVDVESLTADPAASEADPGAEPEVGDAATDAGSDPGLLSRLRPSIGVSGPSLPSLRSFLLTLGVVLGAALGVGMVPLLGAFSGLVGVFAGTFVLGLASGTRRYLEAAVAGGAVAAVSALQGVFRIAVLSDVGLAPFAAVGAGTGLLAAVLGHYFGRDLRSGLVRSVE